MPTSIKTRFVAADASARLSAIGTGSSRETVICVIKMHDRARGPSEPTPQGACRPLVKEWIERQYGYNLDKIHSPVFLGKHISRSPTARSRRRRPRVEVTTRRGSRRLTRR